MDYSSSCSECSNGASIDYEQMAGKHSWAVSVSCRGCNMYWFICSVCRYKGTVVRLSSDAARYRHHRSHHAKGNRCCSMATTSRILPSPYNVINSCQEEGDIGTYPSDEQFSQNEQDCFEHPPERAPSHDNGPAPFSKQIIAMANPPSITPQQFGNVHSVSYFSAEVSKSHLGTYVLVSQSQRGVRCDTSKLYHKHVQSQLKVTKLLLGLTCNQQILFVDVMNDALSKEPIEDCYVSCIYLTSHAMICSHYMLKVNLQYCAIYHTCQ